VSVGALATDTEPINIKETSHNHLKENIPRFKLYDSINNITFTAIMDSGSEDNFIANELVNYHNLRTSTCNSLNMVTANGSSAQINLVTEINPWNSGKILVKCAPLRKGLDIILGYHWMKSKNVIFNYEKLGIKFTNENGRTMEIYAETKNNNTDLKGILMTKRDLKKALKRSEISNVYAITIESIQPSCANNTCINVISNEINDELSKVIKQYPGVYPDEPKLTNLPKPRKKLSQPAMRIDTGEAKPIKLPYYNMSPEDCEELKRQLKILMESKIIRPSTSPWGAPVLFVKKKDGTKRLVIDYRQLNSVTKADAYPMPRIQDNLDRLGKACIFTTLDATSGFHQNPIHEEDVPKTAFHTRYGSYEFLVTPFGLKNSPSAFQRMMNEILGNLLDECVVCYVDDLLIFSKTMNEHVKHVTDVSEKLKEFGIQINLTKSKFARDEVTYCGFRIKAGETTIDPDKIALIKQWPIPQNVSAVRSFLGFVGYYRRYIKNYSGIAAPLTDLTKKGHHWEWSNKEQGAFDELRKCMISSPVLHTPDDRRPFHIWCDAGPCAVGGILQQEFEDGSHPIAYEYHKLSLSEQKYSQYEKEFLALLHCLRKWKHYFEGRKIMVHTDNSSLVQLLKTKRDPHFRIARWLDEFNLWSPDIVHVPGKRNPADVPSRVNIEQDSIDNISDYDVNRGLEVNAIIRSNEFNIDIDTEKDWPLIIAHYLHTNEWLTNIDDELLERCKRELEWFRIKDNQFLRIGKDKITTIPYLPYVSRNATIRRFHNGLGHLKYNSIIDLIKRRYWWQNMDDDIKEFIKRCPQCQLDDSFSNKVNTPLRPIPPVAIPFERWGMDFIQNLPITKDGNRHIITAIDYATRWVVAKAVKSMDTATVVNFLYNDILMNYGCPFEIVSDRGKSFLANALIEFENIQRIKHLSSTPYHPQTNGMIERMHAMIGHSISTLSNSQPCRWDEYLPETIFAIRVRTHAVTKLSPFYLLYGIDPKLPGDTSPPFTMMQPLDEIERLENNAEFRAKQFEELGSARGAAYERTKAQAEAMKRRYNLDDYSQDYYFKVGDWVKMKHYARTKFEFDWKGPYHIVDVGFPGTYWLMDPQGQRLDSTVNQSNLAPWLAPTTSNETFFYDGTNRNVTEDSNIEGD